MQPNTQQNNFKFFMPIDIEKGKNGKGEETYKIKGQASKERKDSQGEVMNLAGMDVSDLKVINWNHKSKDNPDAYIGEVQGVNFKNDEMHFNGELYPEMPMAKGAINLMKALKRRGKQLGISVEGSVVERGSKDPKDPKYNHVVKSKLTALALTPNPINSDTYAELLEKGYTETNNWEFDEETEVLMKSFEEGADLEKAYTVEGNQDLTKEDVEGKKNKKKTVSKIKDIVDDEDKNKESLSKKISKADVYERIFDYFYDVDINKAKSIYNLIEKLAIMDKKEITDEVINKAFEVLEKGSEEGSQSEEEIAQKAKDKEEYNAMVEKGKEVAKGMIDAGLKKEEVTDAMIEKGYGEKVISEAYDQITGASPVVSATNNKEILKSLGSLSENINKKFSAIADIYKSQSEQMVEIQEENAKILEENAGMKEDLNKSFETITELNDTINKFAGQPAGRRRAATKFVDKDFNDGQPIQKSENGAKSFNLKVDDQRKALVGVLTEHSGINKGEKYDQELVKIAQDVEITKSIDTKSLGRLNAMGIDIIQ